MRFLDKNFVVLGLAGVVIFETGLLVRLSSTTVSKTKLAATFIELSSYYVDMLERNDVPLSDFDLVALNTIIAKLTGIEVPEPELRLENDPDD